MITGFIKTTEGVDIFYKDWSPRTAQPIVFHHGWPLSSDDAADAFAVAESLNLKNAVHIGYSTGGARSRGM